jgi:hypothetical protein
MPNYNPKNERAKKDYVRFLKEADRKAESTIDSVRKAICRYEAYTGLKDFATFNKGTGGGVQETPDQNESGTLPTAACQGDIARDRQRVEGLFQVVVLPAWVQVPHPVHGHRISQPLGKGGEGGQAATAQTLSHA